MSVSKSEDENEDEEEHKEGNEEENEDKNEEYYTIKQINDYFKTIDESESFEDQINLF